MEKKEEVQVEQKDVQVKDDSLSQEQALGILVQAIKLAQKRGAFELEETEVILKAVKVFIPKQ